MPNRVWTNTAARNRFKVALRDLWRAGYDDDSIVKLLKSKGFTHPSGGKFNKAFIANQRYTFGFTGAGKATKKIKAGKTTKVVSPKVAVTDFNVAPEYGYRYVFQAIANDPNVGNEFKAVIGKYFGF